MSIDTGNEGMTVVAFVNEVKARRDAQQRRWEEVTETNRKEREEKVEQWIIQEAKMTKERDDKMNEARELLGRWLTEQKAGFQRKDTGDDSNYHGPYCGFKEWLQDKVQGGKMDTIVVLDMLEWLLPT